MINSRYPNKNNRQKSHAFLSTFLVMLFFFCMSNSLWAVSPINVDIDIQTSSNNQGTTGGPLTINRVELFFADKLQGDTTVPLNGKVKALAKIKYTGNGTLQWQWFIDGRVIQQGSRGLVYGSSLDLTTDDIPPLPTFEPGQHQVSFRILKPFVHFSVPSITYFVDTNKQLNKSAIDLYSPVDDSWTKRTQLNFSWSALQKDTLYQINVWPLSGMLSGTKSKRYRGQSTSKRLSTILQIQTRDSHYKPSTSLLTKLQDEKLYEWQVEALNDQGDILATSAKQLFRIRPEYNQSFAGGVFFRSTGITEQVGQDHSGLVNTVGSTTNSLIGSFSNMGIATYSLLKESQNISYNTELTAGQTIYINPRIENSTVHNQQNLTIEIKNGDQLIGRRIIPTLPAHSFFELSHGWGVPMLENQGQLSLSVLDKGASLDQVVINWTATTTTSTSGLNFKEIAEVKPHVFPSPSCGVSTPFFVETVSSPVDIFKKSPPLSSELLSAQVTTMETKSGVKQSISDDGWFNRDEGTPVFFQAKISDNGFIDAYLAQKNACIAWQQKIKDKLVAIAEKLSPKVNFFGQINKQENTVGQASICRNKTGIDKISCLESVSNGSLKRFSKDDLRATANALRKAAVFFGSESSYPESYPFFFEIATDTPIKATTLVWKDNNSPIELHKGDQEQVHSSSTVELPGAPGKFNVSISGMAPQSPLYTTLDGGRPRFLEMAGFTLEVHKYQRQENGALSGTASTYWHGNLIDTKVHLTFHDLTYTQEGSPLYGKVTSGQAKLKDNSAPLLALGQDKEHSYPITLQRLELLSQQAKADLSFQLPEQFHTAGSNLVNFTDIDILNGGEFLAESRFSRDYKDMSIARGDLDIRLAGAALLVDFSEHLASDQMSSDPIWQGMILSGGAIRARVRERSDHPELGLMPAANISYLLGRFSRLELSNEGELQGDAQLVSPTTLPAFFGEATNHQIDLLAPLNYKLEFLSGVFQIVKDGVGGIDLAGRLTLPDQYGSESLRFAHLTRLIRSGKPFGFQTEEIKNNLPSVQLSGVPYFPESARLIIPATLRGNTPPSNEKTSELDLQLQQPTVAQPINVESDSNWPQDSKEMAKWVSHQRATMTIKASERGGLLLSGGTFELPWPEVPVTNQNASNEDTESTGAMATAVATTNYGFTPDYLKKLKNGVFCLTSTGINGTWLETRDKKFHLVGDFTASLDGVRLEFQYSSMIDSLVEGHLSIPYPTSTAFEFSASLDSDLQIILNDEGLKTPEEISLAYWHATLHPGPRLHLDRSGRKETIHIESASLRLDVADEFGGQEFTIPNTDIPGGQIDINGVVPTTQAADPLHISLDIKPDGNIANVNMAISATQPIRDTEIGRIGALAYSSVGSNLLFMGQGFQPEALLGQETPFRFRTYHGDHKQPPADAPPTDEWLIKVTGKINMSLFGEREIRIHHTARGAKVPFISHNGGSGSQIVDRTGLLTFTTQKLRFVNTYALDQDFINARADSYNAATADSQTTGENPFITNSFDSTAFKASKSFVGLTHFDIVDIYQLNGLSEAGIGNFKPSGEGTPDINTCQTNCSYEKIGFGSGVDVGKAVLSALRFGRTTAQGGAQALEQLGALDVLSGMGIGLSQGDVQAGIDWGVDYVSNVSNLIDLCIMAAGEVGSAGAISPGLLDQIRVSIGDGISMVNSSLKIGESIYIGHLQGTEYDLGVQMLHIYEMLLDAVEMAVLYDEFDPDELIKLLLDGADQATVSLITLEAAHLGNIELGSLDLDNMDFGSLGRIDPEAMDLATMPKLSAPIIALNFGRLPIKIAQQIYSVGDLTPEVIMDIFHTAFGSSLGLLDFLDGKRTDGQQSSGSSFHLDQNIYNFLHFGLNIANTITSKDFVGPKGEISTKQLFNLLDPITQFLCTYQNEIGQGLGMAGVNNQDKQNISRGIAASRLVVANLKKLNEQLEQTAVIPADDMVKNFIFPVIDTLLGSGGGLTPCSHEALATTSCGELPHIGKETKLALSVVKETLVIAMELETSNGEIDPIDTLKHIKRYLVLFQDCATLFPADIPFAKMGKNIDDLITIIEPLKNEDNDAKAALEVADILMTLFEERADSMSEITLDKQSRALLETLHAVDSAGLVVVNKGNNYQPADAISSSRKILNTLPKHVASGTDKYRQLDTGTGIINEVLRVVEEKNGRMSTMTADEILALAERSLRIVQERMDNELQNSEKKNLKISLMVLHYSRMALKKVGAEQGTIDDLFASIKEILPTEKDILAYMQAISKLLEEGKKNSADSGQENLAQLIRTIIEDALNQGISPAAEKELRLALLYLNQIKSGNCQFLYTADEQGNLNFIRTTCDDGITREFNTTDNLLMLTYPASSQRYPFGATEQHRVLYDLDIAPYRAALGKPKGDPERQQAVQDICQRLNPADFDSATMISLQSKTSNSATVSWKATEGILTIQETTPSCPRAASYGQVLSPPQFSNTGEPIIQPGYQLLARTWHDSNMASCLQWSQDTSQINRFWDNGNKTTYLYHGMEEQSPRLDTVTTHTGTATWNGKQYRVNYHRGNADTSQPTLKIKDPVTGSTDSVLLAQEYSFNPDSIAPPQNIVLQQKTVIQEGRTDTYDFEHQLFWRKTTPVEQWEFYQMADTLPHPNSINVGQPPSQNIEANPQSYTLLVRMDGETAYNPDGTPLTEPLELPNGVTLRPGSLHISIDGIDFHSISNHVTSELVDGLAVEKVTLDSGMIMSRWTDNDGVKHLKEEVPGMDGTIRLEIHTEELTDGSIRETTTNRMQLPATYIRRVKNNNQIETFVWKEGEQPVRQDDIITIGQYVTAIDSDGNPITSMPQLSPANIIEQMAITPYLAAEVVITALPNPTTFSMFINAIKKIEEITNLQAQNVAGITNRISYLKASVYNNYLTTLLQKAGKQKNDLSLLRGQMMQCDEIKKEKENGHTVPDCTAPAVGTTDPLTKIVATYGMLTEPQTYAHLQINSTNLHDGIAEVLGQRYRIARAALNSHDTMWNRDLVIKVMTTARNFGSEVYQKVCGSDNPPRVEDVVIQRTCLTASQAVQQLTEQAAGQSSTELTLQRMLATLTYNQLATCPTREDLQQHPEEYPELSNNPDYNPDNLDSSSMLPRFNSARNETCPSRTNDPTIDLWSRVRASICSGRNLETLCFCDHSKMWSILAKIKWNFSKEVEKVKAGDNNRISFFETQAKYLTYLDNMSKGVITNIPGLDSGLFGPTTNEQEAFDHYCETKFGINKTQYNAQRFSMCSSSIIDIARENAGGAEGESPDFEAERREVELAIDQGIAAQERRCLENQDTEACANAEKHRKSQKERTQAVAKATSKKVDEKVTEELDSFCTEATSADEILTRLKYWQQVYHDLHKRGVNELSQYDTLVNLWLQNVVADIEHSTINDNTIKRVRCAINLAATLGVLRITQPVEEFIAEHKDAFFENILYAAGWPIGISITFDISPLIDINIDTDAGKEQLINMIKAAYTARRQTMFDEKTPLSIAQFNNIALAVTAMADNGTLFTKDDFFTALDLTTNDPQTAINNVLNQAITASSICLTQNQVHCGMEQVKQLLSLAATAQLLEREPQAVLATAKAKEIIEQMFNESAVANIDFSELRLLLENILKAGDACHDNVVAIMASLYQGMTDLGTDLVNHLTEFGEMMAALQLDIPDFQTQIMPDLLAEIPIAPQLLDCSERLRLALLHLKKGMEFSLPTDPGFAFTKLAETLSRDFTRATDPDRAVIAGQAAMRAAELLVDEIMGKADQLFSTGASGNNGQGIDVTAMAEIIGELVTTSVAQAGGFADQHQAQIQTVLEKLKSSGLLDKLIPDNNVAAIVIRSALNAALTTTISGLDQNTISQLNFDISAFLHETQTQLQSSTNGEAQKISRTMAIPLSVLDFLLPLAIEQQQNSNEDMAITVVNFIGNSLQRDPVTGLINQLHVPALPPVINEVGSILQQAGRDDYPTYIVGECTDFLVTSLWPDQPIIGLTLNWGTSYLINTIDDDLEEKFHRLQDPQIGIPNLVSRVQNTPEFSSLNLPDQIFTVPAAAMISLLENREQLISNNDKQRTEAFSSIIADSLTIALPSLHVNGCGERHPLACMVNTIGHSDDLIEGFNQEKMVNMGIKLIGISEKWLQKEMTGSDLAFTPLLKSFKDIASAGDEIEIALTAMIKLPEITKQVIEMANSVPPEWQKYLDMFALDCNKTPLILAPPDRCSGLMPLNAALQGLENLRMTLLQNVYDGQNPLNTVDTNGSQWGYLKTMPILDPPVSPGDTLMSMLPTITPDDAGRLKNPTDAFVAYIDYGRMLLNLASVLKTKPGTPRYANQIIEESIFAGLIGDPDAFFSGYAGGLLMSSELGKPKDSVTAEIVGTFKLPVLGSIAGQLSMGYGLGTNAYVRIRGGAEIPDFANLFDSAQDMPGHDSFETVANDISRGNFIGSLSGYLDGQLYCATETNLALCQPDELSHSLSYIFHAGISMDMLNIDSTMSGNLNAHDRSGDLCLDINSTIGSASGGLWLHPDTEDGMGLALSTGINFNLHVEQGLVGFTLNPGVTGGLFATQNNDSITAGMCLTPFIEGAFHVLDQKWEIAPKLPVSVFPKEYSVGDSVKHGLGFTYTACTDAEQKNCAAGYLFVPVNNIEGQEIDMEINPNNIGIGNFPERSDEKPWGGMPEAIFKTCDPLQHCVEH